MQRKEITRLKREVIQRGKQILGLNKRLDQEKQRSESSRETARELSRESLRLHKGGEDTARERGSGPVAVRGGPLAALCRGRSRGTERGPEGQACQAHRREEHAIEAHRGRSVA